MDMLSSIFSYILYTSFVVSILILGYLIIKKILLKEKAMRYHHIIWMILIIRLILPVSVETSFSIFALLPYHELWGIGYGNMSNRTEIPQEQKNIELYNTWEYEKGQEIDFRLDMGIYEEEALFKSTHFRISRDQYEGVMQILTKVWVFGMGVLLLFSYILLIRIRRKRRILKSSTNIEFQYMVEGCRKKMNIKRPVPIYLSTYFKNPCIMGVIHPCILLPEDLYNEGEYRKLQYIILHEMAHYKRKDIVCNAIFLVAVLIHWFNPLLWLVMKHIRQDREFACDAYVMDKIQEAEYVPYGRTIIDLAKRYIQNDKNSLYLVCFYEGNSLLERRIKMIKQFKKRSYRVSISVIIFCMVMGIMILTNPFGTKTISLGSENKRQEPKGEEVMEVKKEDENRESTEDTNLADENNENNEANFIQEMQDKLILIDPGHGGEDQGHVYTDPYAGIEINEKKLTLDLSLLLYDILKTAGFNVQLTRKEDKTLLMKDRVELINQLNPALLISIHINASHNRQERGEVILFNSSTGQDLNGLSGEEVARIMGAQLLKDIEREPRLVERNDLQILSSVQEPALIMELGYFTNSDDLQELMTEEYKKQLVQTLYKGIGNVLKNSFVKQKQNMNETMADDIKIQWPVPGNNYISSPYGDRINGSSKEKEFHTGIDIPAPQGTAIVAAGDGKVVNAAYSEEYGNIIMIDHGNGWITRYEKASKLNVTVGDEVKAGAKIGEVGSTGRATGEHLHFEIWENGEHRNPLLYMTKE